MDTILLIGEDIQLLESHAITLALTGASVTCCLSSELDLHQRREMFDLVVLCHTLESAIRRSLIAAEIYRRWPDAFILRIVRRDGDLSSQFDVDTNLALRDPAEFVQSAVAALLHAA
ncbi:MAG: hypothetical protein M3O31_15545 [Acidobacteriota bacterium]|nr:hypothetical protein [Acidobacteriota bacterium]